MELQVLISQLHHDWVFSRFFHMIHMASKGQTKEFARVRQIKIEIKIEIKRQVSSITASLTACGEEYL